MRDTVMFRFLASDYPILLTVLVMLWFGWRRNTSTFRWMWFDKTPWARIASRTAIGTVGVFLLWVTVVDNWRQLLGFLVNQKERWRSDPYLLPPPPDAVRMVTWILLGLMILGTAYLYARYARGYLIPVVVTPAGVVMFFALNSFRMRFELVGPLSDRGVDWSVVSEVLMTLIWFAMFYAVMAILIFSAFAILWGPASIVVSLIYRLTIGREPREEPEMYRILRERSANREDKQHTGA